MMHSTFGKHHARAVHAKGIILTGHFMASAEAKSLSRAAHLQGDKLPVVVRFSDFTGIPDIPDTEDDSKPRGMAVKFLLPDHNVTDIIAHSVNGFPVATTDEFRVFLAAVAASGPEAPKPTPLEQYLAAHPAAKSFVEVKKPFSTSWATLPFFGVNSFKMTNQAGKEQFMRYQLVPMAGEQNMTKEQVQAAGPNYLQMEIKERVAREPIAFQLYAQMAEPGDAVQDPSITWPDSRQRILLGTLTIDTLAQNTEAEDKALSFNPNSVLDGVSIADQMLLDRARSYPISVGQRQ